MGLQMLWRRVWSVAHSLLRPHLACSTGDDGTARLHAGRGLATPAGCLALPRRGPVCGGAFCPEDEHLLALAGADRCAYVFDLRATGQPLHVSDPSLLLLCWSACHCGSSSLLSSPRFAALLRTTVGATFVSCRLGRCVYARGLLCGVFEAPFLAGKVAECTTSCLLKWCVMKVKDEGEG